MPGNSAGDSPVSGNDLDPVSAGKGVWRSLSEGVRSLLVLDEKLLALAKQDDRVRTELRLLHETLFRLVGRIEEMDRRITERFVELDKRLNEIDRRAELQVELAIRKHFERQASERRPRRKPRPSSGAAPTASD